MKRSVVFGSLLASSVIALTGVSASPAIADQGDVKFSLTISQPTGKSNGGIQKNRADVSGDTWTSTRWVAIPGSDIRKPLPSAPRTFSADSVSELKFLMGSAALRDMAGEDYEKDCGDEPVTRYTLKFDGNVIDFPVCGLSPVLQELPTGSGAASYTYYSEGIAMLDRLVRVVTSETSRS